MPIRIPVEGHLVTVVVATEAVEEYTVRVGRESRVQHRRVTQRRDVPPRLDEAGVRSALTYSNAVLAPADVVFSLASCVPHREEIPSGQDRVDLAGFHFLAARYPSAGGVSLLVVADFQRTDLGGEAIEAQSVCIVASLGDPGTGKVLAHELGHLLDLPHVAQGSPRANWNLMYPAYRAGDELTSGQIARARGSRLARRFAGG